MRRSHRRNMKRTVSFLHNPMSFKKEYHARLWATFHSNLPAAAPDVTESSKCGTTSWKREKWETKEINVRQIGHDNVAPAWTKTTKEITCKHHGKESTKNSYLLHLQARIVEFRMASDMEM